jgi:TonB family protein
MHWLRPLWALSLILTGLSANALAQEGPPIAPPEVLERVDAQYPDDAAPQEQDVIVILAVTIGTEGQVEEIAAIQRGGKPFDRAARTAVLQWRFKPAMRDGTPVRAKIRVPFTFPRTLRRVAALPPEAPAPQPPAPAGQSPGHSPSSSTVSGPPAHAAPSPPAAPAQPPSALSPMQVTVFGRSRAPSRGAGDFRIDVGKLRSVPRKNAGEMLQLAPGILLSNEGGEGHAHQVFLRGFDAREGQDIEFTVGGVPINDAGNLHGNGHADTHFIIPEVVTSLRVMEGPFDPRQGNFAVAGSADYLLGVERRGTTVKYTRGSFNTDRMLLLWGPRGAGAGTFGAAELYRTDGFGQNRDARRGSGIAQYEGRVGEKGSYRLTAQGYATNYHTAGVLRDDDYRSGRRGFFDTADFRQGGDASRFSFAGDLEQTLGSTLLKQQLYLIRSGMRLRENFTGFLLDVQTPVQNPHAQRGDGIDLNTQSWTAGARGSSRERFTVGGLHQEFEVGYAARADYGSGSQLRVQASNGVPYRREIDLQYTLADLGLYGDLNLRATRWLTFRGGLRGELFTYNVLDLCAQKSVRQPSRTNPPGDDSCLSQQDMGRYRDPTQRASAANLALLPRATVLFGPFDGFTLSASYGQGVRSMDPIYISQDIQTPFARIEAYEGGVLFAQGFENTQLTARAVFFRTHAERDLIFNETQGRNTLANGTARNGVLGAVRFSGTWLDQSANATLVRATYDDTGLLIPYVPDLVVRSDSGVHHDLPLRLAGAPLKGALGLGVTYVGHRPLPYGQRSDAVFTIDASATLLWRYLELGVSSTNLLNNRVPLGDLWVGTLS